MPPPTLLSPFEVVAIIALSGAILFGPLRPPSLQAWVRKHALLDVDFKEVFDRRFFGALGVMLTVFAALMALIRLTLH